MTEKLTAEELEAAKEREELKAFLREVNHIALAMLVVPPVRKGAKR